MSQHLRIGSEINLSFEDSGGAATFSTVTVTNVTEAYVEVESATTGKNAVPWARVYRATVTTD